MINKMLEKIKDIFQGRAYYISKDELELYRNIKIALDLLPNIEDSEMVVIFDPDRQRYESLLQTQHRYRLIKAKSGMEIKGTNIIIPKIVYDFINSGGNLSIIDNADCISHFGMLHGEKRRLVIV